jgi:tetratricopeptide (TPR) repeat protein
MWSKTMRKYFLSSILLCSTLFANDIYEKAIQSYNHKDYKQAYKLFNLINQPLKNQKSIDFFMGRCAFELGKYDEALIFYERVLFKEPNNKRTILEIGETFFMLKNYNEAKKYFVKVLNDINTPKIVKKKIENRLSIINNKLEKNSITKIVLASIGYDSNIKNVPNISNYDIYIDSIDSMYSVDNTKPISSKTFELGSIVEQNYKLKDDLILNSSLTIYGMKYLEHKESDIGLVSIETGPVFLHDKTKTSIKLIYDHIWYGHKNYIDNYYIMPSFTKQINKSLLTTSYFKFGHKRFAQEDNKEKNSKNYELSSTLSLSTKNYGVVSSNIQLGKTLKTKTSTNVDTNKKYYKIKISDSYKLNNKIYLDNSIGLDYQKYYDYNSNFQNIRKDKIKNYSFGITYRYSNNINFGISFSFDDIKSNQVAYQYKKQIIKSTFIYLF